MERSAVVKFEATGEYRYYLSRRWGGGKSMVFILLNPGTADELHDDPITDKCIAIAKRNGCTAIEVVCIYGYVAKLLRNLQKAEDPFGPDNLHSIAFALSTSGSKVVCAWGASAAPDDVAMVMRLLKQMTITAKCLGVDEDGNPLHPLTLPDTTKLERFP